MGSDAVFWLPQLPGTYVMHMHTCNQALVQIKEMSQFLHIICLLSLRTTTCIRYHILAVATLRDCLPNRGDQVQSLVKKNS